jgi:diaminobutyrate-2-oxoglutarate transaminase
MKNLYNRSESTSAIGDVSCQPAEGLLSQRIESEVRSYCRKFPAVFTVGRGSFLFDINGKQYLDFFCAAGSLNYGHNHPDIKASLLSYIERDGVINSLDLYSEAKEGFLQSLTERVFGPRKLNYKVQFTGPTGANAVEAALKLARKVTGRTNVVCFTNSYHGLSLGALAVTGNSYYRTAAGQELGNATFLPFDGYCGAELDTLNYFERLLKDTSSGLDRPAAVILETIQAEGGVNIASNEWLARLSAICLAHEILLIVDDIQVGCGRTGTFFSFERSGITPDIVILSKSISGAGLPLSLVLIKPDFDLWKPGEHTGTFRGNNLAFVTGRAALEAFWADESFEHSVANTSNLISEWVTQLQAEQNHELLTRGRGLIWAIGHPTCPDFARRVSTEAFKAGLIVETCGGHNGLVKLLPPLNIERNNLEAGFEILQSSIQLVLQQ